jgi:hypothetical protein
VTGQRQGKWTEWRDDGLVARGAYVRDDRHGMWTIEDALLSRERVRGAYRHGEQHGPWRYFDRKGNATHVEDFHRGKRLRRRVAAQTL